MRRGFSTGLIVAVLSLAFAGSAYAQVWRGMGRLAGKTVDGAGQPIAGVKVKAGLAAAGGDGPEVTSNTKGEWAIGGIGSGNWVITFSKEGYETEQIPLRFSESMRLPPRDIVMTKVVVVVDPNVEIKDRLVEAADLMNTKRYAEARAIYEGLAAKYPDVPQFSPLIARAYYGEGNKAKALEHLRIAVSKDPDNVEVKLLLGNILMEEGKPEEAREILASVDETKITSPTAYLNVGIAMINEGKHAEAVVWLDKAIARFPGEAEPYYYRGISYLSLGKTDEAKADLEKFVKIATPDAPELEIAKKILESIK
ncbi:MAG TPA: tetratricopeptide repeat protein [Vicinamibacterales bacterium]|nr:tetratricopeptide repeat protein [Vicinamibacterales bacterium]